jgi:hypothetical protein
MTMLNPVWVAVAASGLWLLAVAAPGLGQQPPDQPPQPTQPPPAPVPPPARPTPEAPPEPEPPVSAPPFSRQMTTPEEPFRAPGGFGTAPLFRGADFFNPPEPRGWMTLTPSLSLAGEYNDNLDFASSGKTSDFIGHIVPGITLGMRRPSYQLSAGYNLDAELYAEHSDRNSLAKSQQLFVDYNYLWSPGVTFSLSERFIYSRESNVVSTSGISVGFRDSWRNTVTPGLAFQVTPRTVFSLTGSYTVLRYDDKGDAGVFDSDTYRLSAGASYQFTPRLSGTVDVGAGLLDQEGDKPVYNFPLRLGLGYQITRTMFGRISVGPEITVFSDETTVTPGGAASLEQVFKYGSIGIGYDRSITAEAIGVTDRQSAFGFLRLTTPRRELQFEVVPNYTHTRNPQNSDTRDFDTFSVDLRMTYQIARNLSLTGSYSYYRQHAGGQGGDIDQNRVIFGIQYAYPINFD